MKTNLITFFALLFSISLFAQSPHSFTYQGVARHNNDVVVGSIGLQLTVHEGSPAGPVVYQERQFPMTNSYGVFSVALNDGTGTVISGDFTTIDWGANPHYLQVELDENGGASYTDMGTSQILSVPYAIYADRAAWAENDGDTNPDNEIQALSLSGSTLSLSLGGGSVNLDDGDWLVSSGNTYNASNNVGIGLSLPTARLHVEDNQSQSITSGVIYGRYTATTNTDGIGVSGYSVPNDYYGIGGEFEGGWRGLIGRVNPTGGSTYTGVYAAVAGGTGTNYGLYAVASGSGTNYAGFFAGDLYSTTDIEAYDNVEAGLDVNAGDDVNIVDDLNTDDAYIEDFTRMGGATGKRVTVGNDAEMRGYGSNGNANYGFGVPVIGGTTYNNNGYVYVMNSFGSIRAGMYVDAAGNGVIFKDVNNFRMEHPEDPSKEIWYACIEGPEVAAYERGTATLVNGEVTVDFSEHFELVINPEYMTVILTPLSADSKGMAVVEKTASGFTVKELANGTGNYSFDWEVKSVRKGYEDYKTIREQADLPFATPSIEPEREAENNTDRIHPATGKELTKE